MTMLCIAEMREGAKFANPERGGRICLSEDGLRAGGNKILRLTVLRVKRNSGRSFHLWWFRSSRFVFSKFRKNGRSLCV